MKDMPGIGCGLFEGTVVLCVCVCVCVDVRVRVK